MGLPTSELLIDLVDATEVAKAHAIEIASEYLLPFCYLLSADRHGRFSSVRS